MKSGALLFFPEELLPLLLVFSGIAMIIGARKDALPPTAIRRVVNLQH